MRPKVEPSQMQHKGLGARLKAAREAIGMSQADLAITIGKPPQSVSRYELGGATPNIGTIAQLAKVLKVEPCWLAWEVEHAK